MSEGKKHRLKNIKKIIARQKSLNIIINKNRFFNYDLIAYAVNLIIHIIINKIVF